MNPPLLAIQAALASKPQQIPVGIALIGVFQYFGGALFQSVNLAVFQNQLVKSLRDGAGLDQKQVQQLLDAGSGGARNATMTFFPAKLEPVLSAYNKAITNVFYVSLAAFILAFILALGIKWTNIKAAKTSLPAKQPVANSASESPNGSENGAANV